MQHRRSTLLALLLIPALASGADDPKTPGRPANRLAKETSPYLLLHAHNPVDWYPWGPEAFARAKAENKPIFLSVGYSSCYWCHVMERESFMNPEIARAINANFVAIKVDREERPDVDQVYMAAVQAYNGGGGGWPMTAFLTPDGRPFFGATYFPPAEFAGLLKGVAEAWRDQRANIEKDADTLTDAVRRTLAGPSQKVKVALTRELAKGGVEALGDQFDPAFGGFGFEAGRPRRPKFPEPVNLVYLLDEDRRNRASGIKKPEPDPREMVVKTLDEMARGGIRDHLAGGYHRYSTDRYWAVPHFEKMLYDNAQIAETLVLASEATGDPRWKAEAEATFAFVARTMTAPDGLFYSALDAESEAEEGKTYVWSRAEVEKVLGPGADFDLFARTYGLGARPNFEGDRHVLLLTSPLDPTLDARLAPSRAKLLAARDKRPQPLLDDKILTAWNGLMIAALAEGHRVFKDDRHRIAAEKAADTLLATMTTPDGRLLRTSRGGKAKLPAYLEDYASLTLALVRLHASTGAPKRLEQARKLADRMIADFADPKDGGFFFTAGDHETLLARVKDPFDGAVPGANSLAIRALVQLGKATNEPRYLDEAGKALGAFAPSLSIRPSASPLMLLALEEYLDLRPTAEAPDAAPSPKLPGAPGVVVAKAGAAKPASVTPGGEFEVELTLTIQDGYHIYANPAGSDDAIPTVVTLSKDSKADLVATRYPAGESKALAASGPNKVNVHEKAVAIVAVVRIPADAPVGPTSVKFRIRAQACNDKACLAPSDLEATVMIDVKSN